MASAKVEASSLMRLSANNPSAGARIHIRGNGNFVGSIFFLAIEAF